MGLLIVAGAPPEVLMAPPLRVSIPLPKAFDPAAMIVPEEIVVPPLYELLGTSPKLPVPVIDRATVPPVEPFLTTPMFVLPAPAIVSNCVPLLALEEMLLPMPSTCPDAMLLFV